MTARTETSIASQEAEPELSGPSSMYVALIGPNDAHRKIVAKALVGSEGTRVREYSSYPSQFADLPRLLEQGFDVVLIDVDSDESYALALIENMAASGGTRVVAYSKRDHPELALSCLQAGAQDLLPLPDENEEETLEASPNVVEEIRRGEPESPRTFEIRRAPEPGVELKIADPKTHEVLSPARRDNGHKPEPAAHDFTDWDARFLRPLKPEVTAAPEPKPQPMFGRKRSKKFSLRVTPLEITPLSIEGDESPQPQVESEPPVDVAPAAAVETRQEIVEDTPRTVESRQPEVESEPPAVESLPAAVASLPAVVEDNQPEAENFQLTFEDEPPVVENHWAAIENAQAAVEVNQPEAESLSFTFEDEPPAAENFWATLADPPAVVENNQPEAESLPLTLEDEPPVAENFWATLANPPAVVENNQPEAESLPLTFEDKPPVVENHWAAVESALASLEKELPDATNHMVDEDSDPTVATGRANAIEPRPEPRPLIDALRPAAAASPASEDAGRPLAVESRPAVVENNPPKTPDHLLDDDSDPTVDAGRPATIARSSTSNRRLANDPIHASEDAFTPAKKPVRFLTGIGEDDAIEDDDEDDEKPHRSWLKWLLIPTGLGLAAGLLMFIPWHSFQNMLHSAVPANNISQQTEQPDNTRATGRQAPRSWRTALDTNLEEGDAPEAAAPVSSDLMVAQLTTPSRIPVDAKRPAPLEEPPAGLAPGAIASGAGIPSLAFGKESNVEVVPGESAISAGVASGLLMHRTEPVYPPFARENHMSGTVLMAATITKTGTISGLRVLSGPTVFRSAAVDAVKTWRYKPYMLDNKPVDVQTTISVVFKSDVH